MTQLNLFTKEEIFPTEPEPRPWEECDLEPADYDPGHPWYYLLGGEPPKVDAIEPITACGGTTRLPKNPKRRVEKIRGMLADARKQLAADIVRYIEVCELGADALSKYDREIAHGGDDAIARASALALKHNHIAWGKRRVVELSQLVKGAEGGAA